MKRNEIISIVYTKNGSPNIHTQIAFHFFSLSPQLRPSRTQHKNIKSNPWDPRLERNWVQPIGNSKHGTIFLDSIENSLTSIALVSKWFSAFSVSPLWMFTFCLCRKYAERCNILPEPSKVSAIDYSSSGILFITRLHSINRSFHYFFEIKKNAVENRMNDS